jgi:hypothetical protein
MTANARASGRLLVTSARSLATGTDGARPDRAMVWSMPTTPQISRFQQPWPTGGVFSRLRSLAVFAVSRSPAKPIRRGCWEFSTPAKGSMMTDERDPDTTAHQADATTTSPVSTVTIGWAEIGGCAPTIGSATLGGAAPTIGSFSMLQPVAAATATNPDEVQRG